MAVSNPATLSSVRAEFGGPTNLAAYVRGGAYVPSNASTTIATTAGALRLSQFNGVSKPAASVGASISPATISATKSTSGVTVFRSASAFTATGTGGNGTYTYAWSIVSTSNSTGAIIDAPTSKSTTVGSAVTTTTYDGVENTGQAIVNIKCVITSAGVSATATATAYFNQSYAACVGFNSYMADGRRAGEYVETDTTVVTDPFSTLFNSNRGEVIHAWTATVPGVRITTALGAVLECSTTAPIPVQEGGYALAPDLYDRYIPTAAPEDIGEPHTAFLWDRVVMVEPIAQLVVRGMYVTNQCFWASKDGKRFILHHNAKPIAIP